MTSRKKLCALLLGVVLATGFLIAQGPPGPPDPTSMAQHQIKFLTTVLSLTSTQQQQAFLINTLHEQGACDVSYGLPGRARFRVNVFIQRGRCAVVMRVIPTEIPDFANLNLPAQLAKISLEHLVLRGQRCGASVAEKADPM